LKEGQGKAVEGYKYVFVYLHMRSELLHDPDRLRELSVDLSKQLFLVDHWLIQTKEIIPDRFKHSFVFSGGVNQWNSFCHLSAGYILHCTQINSFELGNSTHKHFEEIIFLLL